MRPVRLEVKGFTAFREPQEIDFEGLDLFAVSGQTGSGKSSLLDAMTYALFGYVERVGKQVGQLVSQGQPRMAVSLEFEVGEQSFRVARSTPASRGPTKILLERLEDGEWRQAGEGADRVRDADLLIRGAIGLDYEAFTRSVLLPQGRFAEFLVGEAKERRAILTELLGLELFERLARRAGELKRTSTVQAEATERLLATEYAGVTEEAVADAESLARAAVAHDERLTAAEKTVRDLAERWLKAEAAARELLSCAADARAAGATAREAAKALEGLAARLAETDAALATARRGETFAGRAAEKATRARVAAEAKWGAVKELTAARARAEALWERRSSVEETKSELRRARAEVPSREASLAKTGETVTARAAALEEAAAAAGAARDALEGARHADLVAAVRAGARVGEPCPVCGAKIESLPRGGRAPDLERAGATVERAERKLVSAEEGLRKAERERDAAAAAVAEVGRDVERRDRELTKQARALASAERDLSASFGGRLPADPLAALDERIERIEELEESEAQAARAAATAERETADAERARDGIAAEVAQERGRLEAWPPAGLLERARSLAGTRFRTPDLAPASGTKDAELDRVSAALASGLEGLAGDLESMAAQAGSVEEELLGEALGATEGLVEPAGTLGELVEAIAGARRVAAVARATAEKEAVRVLERLENARALVAELREHRARAERFGALAAELRADRIIAFLQLEALQVLAAAGSEHLSLLSGGRYRLAYEGDEFFVVDTWNGEEMRSARTLSGGETFLAALGLALALSEQVRSLAVDERATLDSLFLDEGFGTLDPETLETVVEAIEQLGGDGRMVGVVTHVQELAMRLPVRIEVEKSPRGSRVTMVR